MNKWCVSENEKNEHFDYWFQDLKGSSGHNNNGYGPWMWLQQNRKF